MIDAEVLIRSQQAAPAAVLASLSPLLFFFPRD